MFSSAPHPNPAGQITKFDAGERHTFEQSGKIKAPFPADRRSKTGDGRASGRDRRDLAISDADVGPKELARDHLR